MDLIIHCLLCALRVINAKHSHRLKSWCLQLASSDLIFPKWERNLSQVLLKIKEKSKQKVLQGRVQNICVSWLLQRVMKSAAFVYIRGYGWFRKLILWHAFLPQSTPIYFFSFIFLPYFFLSSMNLLSASLERQYVFDFFLKKDQEREIPPLGLGIFHLECLNWYYLFQFFISFSVSFIG